MKIFETAKEYYDAGNWGKNRLRMLVKSKLLTEEQYKEITDEDYSTDNE